MCVSGCPCRVGVVSAKYGEGSVYFDLGEIDNTTGNWDLYGNDDPSRYNGFQVKSLCRWQQLFELSDFIKYSWL